MTARLHPHVASEDAGVLERQISRSADRRPAVERERSGDGGRRRRDALRSAQGADTLKAEGITVRVIDLYCCSRRRSDAAQGRGGNRGHHHRRDHIRPAVFGDAVDGGESAPVALHRTRARDPCSGSREESLDRYGISARTSRTPCAAIGAKTKNPRRSEIAPSMARSSLSRLAVAVPVSPGDAARLGRGPPPRACGGRGVERLVEAPASPDAG